MALLNRLLCIIAIGCVIRSQLLCTLSCSLNFQYLLCELMPIGYFFFVQKLSTLKRKRPSRHMLYPTRACVKVCVHIKFSFFLICLIFFINHQSCTTDDTVMRCLCCFIYFCICQEYRTFRTKPFLFTAVSIIFNGCAFSAFIYSTFHLFVIKLQHKLT